MLEGAVRRCEQGKEMAVVEYRNSRAASLLWQRVRKCIQMEETVAIAAGEGGGEGGWR
jgi:hypothetical protein